MWAPLRPSVVSLTPGKTARPKVNQPQSSVGEGDAANLYALCNGL